MEALIEDIRRPSKREQRAARESYEMLRSLQEQKVDKLTLITIDTLKQPLKVPPIVMELLTQIMHAMSEGKPITIVPVATELTTQAAAEMLGCSRPHLVKLLETGEIPFSKVGRHRRVKYEDILRYKNQQQATREKLLKEIMQSDEESGLYDT
jgi:excisionase family DNA binding protein